MKSKKTKFHKEFDDWILTQSVNKLAKVLGVSEVTIINWRNGRCDPTVRHMRRIHEITNGKIKYEHIIDRDFEALKGDFVRV